MEFESENSSPSTSSTNLELKLGFCEVCAINQAKYTCPRCEVKSCSLTCVNIHKKEVECNGERDKTKFIGLKKFTNLDLLSDYRLLEEITRSLNALKKNPARIPPNSKNTLPLFLSKLHQTASARQTILKFLPKNFARRKQNTTHFNQRSSQLFWHIDWIFPNADNLKLSDTNVPETARISNLLNKYLIKQDDQVVQQKLQYYQAADLPGLKVFLKAEQKAGCKFYELDPLTTLKDCLKNKVIIEYPIIYVVLKEHINLYDLIDSDDENEDMDVDRSKTSNGNDIIEQIVKKAEKEESLDYSLKNLLFISEVSENENTDAE